MSGSVNKAIIVGNLGIDPEINELPSGQKVANLRVATSEQWTDRVSGEKREKTQWHSIAVFEQNTVDFISKFLGKGDKVYIEGKVQTRKWQDQTGGDRYSTEIVVGPVSGQLLALSRALSSNLNAQEETEAAALGHPDWDDTVIPF